MRSATHHPVGLVATNVSARDGMVCLEVRDTGKGIRAEDLPHVWERFFRGRSEHGEGGAGLGLALVKELTGAMDGTVGASSEPGEGSVFTVGSALTKQVAGLFEDLREFAHVPAAS